MCHTFLRASVWARNHRTFIRFVFYTGIAVILYFAFTPLDTPVVDSMNDKVKHVLAFLLLTCLFSLAYEIRIAFIAAILFMLGAVIEGVQYFLPQRQASVWDMIASAAGVILFLALKRLWDICRDRT
jgi:VanZ family protein